MIALLAVSAVLLSLRIWAATHVGFGDSEALYVAYAAHPQPAYLDHPGLVGLVARAIGGGAVPGPARVHAVTAFAATLVPAVVYAAARALGAPQRRSAVAALAVAVVPEIAVGLFALTPDLLLAPLWLGSLALAGVGLSASPSSERESTNGALALLAAGLLAGVAAAAKVSGLLLMASLATTYAIVALQKRPESRAARSMWPWAGLVAGALVLVPVLLFESHRGWPMLAHRLVDTQADAGLSLRNAGALVGGQLLYVSPVLAVVACLVARDLWRARDDDATSVLLFVAFVVPLVPLAILCLWSRVAEPHWLAPALLALPLYAARAKHPPRRRLVAAGIGVGAAMTAAVYAWVLVPSLARVLPKDVDPKLDIASELYGWPTVLGAAREEMRAVATPFDPTGHDLVFVGPHWTICAQLQAGLPHAKVGCATPIRDDFDDWLPRAAWKNADKVLFVTDARFDRDGSKALPGHVPVARSHVRILRGGRTARVFSLILYDRVASSRR